MIYIVYISYIIASLCFILGLKGLGKPNTARRGINLAAVGMLVAVVGTLLHQDIIRYEWIIAGLIVGTVIGIPMGLWIPMTKMPERIALSHSFGGLAVAIVGIVEYIRHSVPGMHISPFSMGAVGFEVLLGSLTFTGSLMAFGKLQGFLPGKPQTFKSQNQLNLLAMAVGVVLVVLLIINPHQPHIFYTVLALGFVLGVSLVLPIGGADMPVVICLLNSYAGLAASFSGFALGNTVLIICGALDGGSGFILAMLMSKAMNRSFRNVIFGAFGGEVAAPTGDQKGVVVEMSVEEAAEVLKAASKVIVVPGYGLAVAQAQHAVREMGEILENNGTEIKYVIHPVAGRMPGHMNVLLAEANVPYDSLVEPEDVNPNMENVDVAIIIGANDVVNPSAKTDKSSPIYGMPIIEVDRAKTVFVLKRSMASGFSGIDNPLFYCPNTRMVFGDAKNTVQALLSHLKSS